MEATSPLGWLERLRAQYAGQVTAVNELRERLADAALEAETMFKALAAVGPVDPPPWRPEREPEPVARPKRPEQTRRRTGYRKTFHRWTPADDELLRAELVRHDLVHLDRLAINQRWVIELAAVIGTTTEGLLARSRILVGKK